MEYRFMLSVGGWLFFWQSHNIQRHLYYIIIIALCTIKQLPFCIFLTEMEMAAMRSITLVYVAYHHIVYQFESLFYFCLLLLVLACLRTIKGNNEYNNTMQYIKSLKLAYFKWLCCCWFIDACCWFYYANT